MRILVTGGAGFIGSNLCRHLLDAPLAPTVVVLDDLSNGRKENLDQLDVDFREGSILDAERLAEAAVGADAIVHLAALGSVPRSIADPMATHRVNATGTLEVLEAARAVGGAHVVVASSSSVYGATQDLPKHEGLPTRPLSPYGASKLATEWYALAYQHSLDLPVLAFRFFNVFGPNQPADHPYAAVIPRFVAAALDGRPLTVYGDGRQTRDFTYVDTVCATIVDALTRRVTHPEPVNLAFGEPRDLLTVIAALEARLDRRVAVEHTEPRPGDIRHSDADWSVLRELFPTIIRTPFAQGLAATIDWFVASRPSR